MHDDKWVAHWSEELESVFFRAGDREQFDQRERPTDDHLNLAEVNLGMIVLPASYRAFIKVFGPGRLGCVATVMSPGYRGGHVIDLLGANKTWMKNRKQGIIPEGEEALIWFSDFSYGPFCGWRPAVVTNEVDSEYEIVCRRGPEDLLVVAGTFHEYVEMIFSGAMWRKLGEEPIMEWTDEETGETHSSRCFEPIGRSPTSRT